MRKLYIFFCTKFVSLTTWAMCWHYIYSGAALPVKKVVKTHSYHKRLKRWWHCRKLRLRIWVDKVIWGKEEEIILGADSSVHQVRPPDGYTQINKDNFPRPALPD